jgi:hypothetical protein
MDSDEPLCELHHPHHVPTALIIIIIISSI